MYSDDTTMYMDILPFDMKPLEVEPNKLLLQEPSDPWLMNQAGITDIQLPATNTSNTTSIFGRLSPTMEQLANSLLPSEMLLPQFDDTFDVDVALDSITTQNEDSLHAALESLELEPSTPQPQVATQRRRSKRLSSRSANPNPHTSAEFYPYSTHDFNILVDQGSGLPSVGEADDDGSREDVRVQQKRRQKVSYSTLTEDEKYQHIRTLNNEASRHYRERMRHQLMGLQEREIKEKERNRVLRKKAEGLEKLRDQIKVFTYNFFKEHVGNSVAQ